MDYVNLEHLKARVNTALADYDLQEIIAAESAMITRALGVEPGSPATEYFYGAGPVLFLTFAPLSGSVAVTQIDDGVETEIKADTYTVMGPAIVRNSAMTTRSYLDASPKWPRIAKATYAPADVPGILAICQGVCIDLCRLAINEMGVEQSESIGGYSHSSKDTNTERRRILARLGKVKATKPAVAR